MLIRGRTSSTTAMLVAALASLPAPRALAQPVHHGSLLPPLAPLQGPTDMSPMVYHALRDSAERQFGAGDWASAARSYTRLVRAYSVDGENWARLGRARASLGDDAGAIEALEQGIALGVGYQGSLYTGFTQNAALAIARAHARLGQKTESIQWLERTVFEGRYERRPQLWGERTFAALQDDPRFVALTGRALGVEALDRVAGWRGDVDHLLAEIARLNDLYHRAPLPDSIVAAAGRLKADVPRLSDVQVALGIHHLTAMLGISHNYLLTLFGVPGGRVQLGALPLKLYEFPDGMYVIDADSAHRHLVGARVDAIEGRPVDSLLQLVRPLIARDHPQALALGGGYLARPAVLHALGLARRPDTVELRVARPGAPPIVERVGAGAWSAGRKLGAFRVAAAGAPRWLSRPDDEFWIAPLPEQHALYVQFNQVADKANGESLAAFGQRLHRQLSADTSIHTVVLDLRRNNGGNSYLYGQLLRTLIAFDHRPGTDLYALISRHTYSAAMNFATELDRLTDAIFVGEPSGGTPIQWGGDESAVTLPWSQLPIALTSVRWQLTSPRDTRPFIAPDVPAPLTAAAYFANQDPAMDAVLALIAARSRWRDAGAP